MRRLASLEARLNRADLSLQQIDEIAEQIVVQTTDKTRGVAVGLLNRCEARKPALIDRQIRLVQEATDPIAKIKLLTPLIGHLNPTEVDEQLKAIEFEASLSENPKVQEAVKKQLEHLQFAQAKPLLHDLKHFMDQAQKVGAAVQRTQSLAPLQGWNNVQWGEVRRAAIGGRS